jgi:hypothetical protein
MVTADEAAAIVMAGTHELGTANDSRNTLKEAGAVFVPL